MVLRRMLTKILIDGYVLGLPASVFECSYVYDLGQN